MAMWPDGYVKRDYSLRAHSSTDDEMGSWSKRFNSMLMKFRRVPVTWSSQTRL